MDVLDPVLLGILHHVGHRERRCRLPQVGEGLVADVQQTLGQVAPAGDGEVPGQVELAPLHARLAQDAEHVVHGLPLVLDDR